MMKGIITAPGVTVIPAAPRIAEGQKLRACAYGRVSTDAESQQLSYTTQRQYYSDFISSQPGLQFVGFYGDEAISGTNRFKRRQFNRMMDDARAHRFDVIYTKSISRFARNTLDTLKCVRELKDMTPPVEVIFEKESLSSLDARGELVLTIMSALAQDESRSISENIKWSLQKKFQNGEPMVNLDRMLGYDWGENKAWVINEAQAEIVRFIYRKYAEGHSANAIARELNGKGIRTLRGKIWRADGIMFILRNEKYAGNLILQKTYTPDYLTHRAVKNNGAVPQYLKENHHPAIVDGETLRAVADRLEGNAARKAERKGNRGGKEKPVFCSLTVEGSGGRRISLVRMGYRASAPGGSFQYPVWKTPDRMKLPGLDRCYLVELAIEQSFMEMLYRMKKEYEEQGEAWAVCRAVKARLDGMAIAEGNRQRLALIGEEIRKTEEAWRKAAGREVQLLQSGGDAGIYFDLISDLNKKLEMLRAQKEQIEARDGENKCRLAFHHFQRVLESLPAVCPPGGKSEEGLDAGPALLSFNGRIYDKFITAARVLGDEIAYDTTFGVTVKSAGNSRTLGSFLGFRRLLGDGTAELLDETWKVCGKAVTPGRKDTAAEQK